VRPYPPNPLILTEARADDCFRHGAQGVLDGASKATLENEFGTHNEDECMIKILENGDLQETEVSRRKCTKAFGHLSNWHAVAECGAFSYEERLEWSPSGSLSWFFDMHYFLR